MNYNNPRKNPPQFSSLKGYEQWRKEIDAWTKLTKEDEADWAKLVALGCLSPDDPSGIRDKVFALNLEGDEAIDEVRGENNVVLSPAVPANPGAGWKRFMDFMDQEFAKDNLTDMCEHIRKFMKLTKPREQTMKAYVSNFEATYKKAKEKGLPDMPDKFLMWFLLESAGITDHEYMLVLTGVPSDSANMYVAAKTSLLRFFNSDRAQASPSHSVGLDACLDTHWQRQGGRGYQGNRGYQGAGQYGGGQHGGGGAAARGASGGGGPRGRGGERQPWKNPHTKAGQQQIANNKPLNPKDENGDYHLCNSCGSYRHFVKDCPYKDQFFTGDEIPYDPTNDPNLNEGQGNQNGNEEENSTYNTHFNSVQLFDILINDVFHNEHTLAKLFMDTGCVRSVAGRKWFREFIMTLSEETRKRIMKYLSHARFRFGGTDIKPSLGLYTVPCSINGKNIMLQLDIIDNNIPCLISKAAMKKAGGIINLEEDTIRLYGQVIKMDTAPSGHQGT